MSTSHKEKIIRVLQLFQTTDEKTPMNAVQISQKLEEEYGMENVHRTSIYDDVRLLQSCGYPIKQAENSHKGWYMEKHLLEDWEIKLMLDSVQQARCVSVHEANEIRNKLLNLTSQRGRSRFSHMIMPLPGNVRGVGQIGEYIEIMLEAMYLHKKIRFQYTEINNAMEKVLRKEGKMYQLNLYTIYWSDNNYYLIGSHDNHDGLTNYRLDRIENMSMSSEEAIPAEEKIGVNPELVIQDYIKKSVNHFSGDTIRIEVEYEPSPSTNAILYDFAGDGIRVRPLEKGKYKAVFKKMDSVTLVGWFVQYLVLYQKYTYEDACRLLNWERNEVPLNIGGYKYDKKTKTFPIFINYDKQDNISDTTKYEDHFVAENRLIAISKSGRSMDSEDVQNFLNATERGIDVQLFVRKNKDDKISKEFYYLGRVIATGNAKQFVMPNTDKTAVEIEWELETPVREDIYQYIVNE